MSKAEGKKIAVKFTMPLLGDVTGNVSAFGVTGQEYQYINGPIINKNYTVTSVERPPTPKIWEEEFIDGTLSNAELIESGLVLTSVSVPGGLSEDLTPGKTYFAVTTLATNPEINAFDNNLNTFWRSSSGVPGIIGVDFGEPIAITKLNMAGVATRAKDFILQGSNDYSTWSNVYSGVQTNDNVLREYFFSNSLAFRYYRIYISTVWNTGHGPGLSEIEMMSEGSVSEYSSSGTYESATLSINGNSRIKWSSTLLEGTNVLIQILKEDSSWQTVDDGDVVNYIGKIKATLSTTDASVTPTLSAVWLEAMEGPQDILKLTIDQFARFNNVEGQLKVSYDSALGTLVGVGGAVQSFEAYFTPTDLLREINPNDEETVRATISSASIDYSLIQYENAYHEHTVNAVASVVVEYTDVTIVNP